MPAARAAAGAVVVWVLPVLVIWVIYFSPRQVISPDNAVAYLIALGVLVLATRRPDRSLIALIVLLPFQGLLLAKLWAWGVPVSIVRHMGAWKEALALGIVIAGFRSFIACGRSPDVVDWLALAFVAFVALYAAFQPEILPHAPSATSVRLLGFREAAGFVLVLLGARHAPLGPGFADRAARVVLAVGATVAAVGVYEAIFSSSWNHFVVHTIGYTGYQSAVLHSPSATPDDIRIYGSLAGIQFVRIGSVFLNELTLAWYLILPFAVGLERAVRRSASPLVLLATVLMGAALLLTQTRSGILAALIVAFLALWPSAGRHRHWRTRVAILLTGLAVFAVPAAFATGVTKRVKQVNNRSDQSTAGHISGFSAGVDTIRKHPLGQGLGTSAGIGQRFTVQNDVVPENNYLDIGDELGVLPMLTFVALTVALILALRRTARQRSDPLIMATWAAGVGLAVAAWFLQTWLDFGVTWTYWGLAGAMLGLARQQGSVASERERPGRTGRETSLTPAFQRAASSASR